MDCTTAMMVSVHFFLVGFLCVSSKISLPGFAIVMFAILAIWRIVIQPVLEVLKISRGPGRIFDDVTF